MKPNLMAIASGYFTRNTQRYKCVDDGGDYRLCPLAGPSTSLEIL